MTPPSTEPTIGEYRLRLDVDVPGLRWDGSVEFDAPTAPGRYALDCEGLSVRGVRQGAAPLRHEHDRGAHRLDFELSEGGTGPVVVDFAGEVERHNLFGLYRSSHGSGTVLTSHCEPTGARRIFPCVDRPDRKARIVLRVGTGREWEVISNTPGAPPREANGGREWTFEPTPLMSTYLFYLGIGRFEYRTDRSSPVEIRVATAPGRGDAAAWALRSAGRILRAYEAYYKIPYPLPKLDLIAIAEHAFGAMENWGAISFQEARLLVDSASASFATRDVFETSAHEIAHQWFGNLVTMVSWDDIWLNESFASLMETKITEQLEPAFDPWSDFFLRTAGKAMAVDADSLRSTHPVRAHVEQPEEMSQIFDEISYGKGSSVLAMIDRYLGEEAFRGGVADYLKRFAYRNATTDDLLASLDRATGEPVGAIVRPWIDRPGLPIVRARVVPGGVHLSQRRFGYLGETDEPPWPIPMSIEVNGRQERLLFDTAQRTLVVPDGATVLLNPSSLGFYRVLYDRPLLDRLLAHLPARTGPGAWAVVDDLAAFVDSGAVDWGTFATAVERFRQCEVRLVIESLGQALTGYALAYPSSRPVLESALAFLREQTERIGIDRRSGEPSSNGILRERLGFSRVRLDDAFASELAPRSERWTELDPDLRSSVAIAAVRTLGDRGVERIRALHEKAGTGENALHLERALAWSPSPEVVREILDRAAAGKINRSHVLRVAAQAAANPSGRATSWQWLQENLERLDVLFRGSGYLPLLLTATLPMLGRGRVDEVRAFFDRHPTPSGSRGLAKGLERLEIAEALGARLS